ncbi:MAG: SDR family NAD(P)-dependent oxidoreductase [Woeseia sp.]
MQSSTGKLDQFLLSKRIVISGAGRGLGRALAIVAADHGADTVLLGRNVAALDNVASSIRARTQRSALVAPCDLANPDSIATACEQVLGDNPTVDVLINNGAPWLTGELAELSDADIVATVSAAVSGTILLTKGLLPGLHRSAAADIVTIVSTAAIPGQNSGAGSAPFFAAKHAQSGFSDRLRHELRGKGVRVSAIYPPDFDDADPLEPDWNDAPTEGAALSNREIVSTVLFILASSRACCFPAVVIEATTPESS